MAEKVAIKERIARVLAARLAAATGAVAVYRFDARVDLQNYQSGHIVIKLFDAVCQEAAQGSMQTDKYTLAMGIAAVLIPDESGTESTDVLVQRWQARLKYAAFNLGDVTYPPEALRETTVPNSMLARGMRCVTEYEADYDEGIVEAGIELEVEYETYWNDPYNGPGITELQE